METLLINDCAVELENDFYIENGFCLSIKKRHDGFSDLNSTKKKILCDLWLHRHALKSFSISLLGGDQFSLIVYCHGELFTDSSQVERIAGHLTSLLL